ARFARASPSPGINERIGSRPMRTDVPGIVNRWSSRSARNLARRSRFLSPVRGSDPACHALSFVSDRTMIVRILSRSACNQTEHVAPKAGIQVFLNFPGFGLSRAPALSAGLTLHLCNELLDETLDSLPQFPMRIPGTMKLGN